MTLLENIFRKVKLHVVGLEINEYESIAHFFLNKTGIEIGGPSGIFKDNNILPVYRDALKIDGVNFSTQTIWENIIEGGHTYNYGKSNIGYQFIAEANDLHEIRDKSYDFLLSSHSLEHCANVIKTLIEWNRVVRDGGIMIIVVPNKEFTFDHNRTITTLNHLLEDYQNNVGEDDLTHFQEIVDKHDLSRDPGVMNRDQFIERAKRNIDNRCLHHHVFDINFLIEIFNYMKMKILFTGVQPPFHQIIIVQKP